MNPTAVQRIGLIYGLLRLALGLAEIIALLAGYFFLEWIIRYPSGTRLYLLEDEMIVLAYAVMLLRGVFHATAGIAIVRCRPWARWWLWGGWLVMVLITAGYAASFGQLWLQEGRVSGPWAVIAWPKVLVYAGWIAFDVVALSRWLAGDARHPVLEDERAVLTAKQIAGAALGLAVFFGLLLFWGQPIKQGFHRGFYKTHGTMADRDRAGSPTAPASSRQAGARQRDSAGNASLGTTILSSEVAGKAAGEVAGEPSRETASSDQHQLQRDQSKTALMAGQDPARPMAGDASETTAAYIIPSTPGPDHGPSQDRSSGSSIREGVAYRTVTALFGGLCLIAGLLLMLLGRNSFPAGSSPVVAFVVWAVGFLAWSIYGLSSGLWPIGTSSLICLCLCGALVYQRMKA